MSSYRPCSNCGEVQTVPPAEFNSSWRDWVCLDCRSAKPKYKAIKRPWKRGAIKKRLNFTRHYQTVVLPVVVMS